MLLLLDNFDSFTHNLAHLLAARGAEVWVVRADHASAESMLAHAPSHVVISPGPGHPQIAKTTLSMLDLLAQDSRSIPLLGVCLGHQAMALHERGVIARGTRPIHGETSQVSHDKRGTLFLQVPSTFVAMRYHSLVVEDAGPSFDVVATTAAREIMAIQHRTRPWFGLQFHPESFLSEYGADIVDAFLSAPSDIAQTSAPTHVGEVFRL